jgi:biotin operon repressor
MSTREFRKLQAEWYQKLKDDGFYDIEGGVDGHLLKGPTSTISLRSFANKTAIEQGLKNDRAPREFDDVADALNDELMFATGGKARYYHHASLLACQAISEGLIPDEVCYAWQLHSLGEGERVIADLLEVSRAQIRKHIAYLRHNIHLRLAIEPTI